MSTIYIVLPVHNRCTVTQNFIACLKSQTESDYLLLLVDDGSSDGTSEMVRKQITSLELLQGNGQLWWAGSLQKAIDWLSLAGAKSQDIVLFANDDITFEPQFLADARKLMDANDRCLLLPHIYYDQGETLHDSGVNADLTTLRFTPAQSAAQINCLPTRGLFLRYGDIKEIGQFHPWLLPHYLSDYEYTIRAKRKGFRLFTSSDISVRLDRTQTGFHVIEEVKFLNFVKKYFSKKNPSNPVYWTTFVLLTVDSKKLALGLIVKIWLDAIQTLLAKARAGLSRTKL